VATRKRKTTPTADASEAAAFAAYAEQRKADYGKARAKHDEARKAHALAVAEVARVERAAAEDASSVNADDLLRAQAGVRLAEIAVESTTTALRAAERARVSTDVSLAAALVSFVGSVLGVVPTVLPYRPTEVPTDLPCAAIVQTQPADHDRRSGRLSGEVEVHYARTPLHREAEAAAFARAAEKRDHGVMLSAGASGWTDERDGLLVDVVRLPVFGVLPALPEVLIGDPVQVAREVAAEVCHRTGLATAYTVGAGMPLTGLDTGRRLGVQVEPVSSRVLSDQMDGDTRCLTVEAVLRATPGRLLSAEMRETYTVSRCGVELAAAVEGVAGAVLSGVGKVTGTSITATDVEENAHGRPAAAVLTVRATVVAKVPAAALVALDEDDDEDQDGYPDPPRRRDPREYDYADGHPALVDR
jgi:hypothetical protein